MLFLAPFYRWRAATCCSDKKLRLYAQKGCQEHLLQPLPGLPIRAPALPFLYLAQEAKCVPQNSEGLFFHSVQQLVGNTMYNSHTECKRDNVPSLTAGSGSGGWFHCWQSWLISLSSIISIFQHPLPSISVTCRYKFETMWKGNRNGLVKKDRDINKKPFNTENENKHLRIKNLVRLKPGD